CGKVAGTLRCGAVGAVRESESAALPAETGPFVANGAMDLVRACRRGPVDRSMFEVIESSAAVRGPGFVGERKSQKASLAAEPRPFHADVAVDLVRARTGTPVNGA